MSNRQTPKGQKTAWLLLPGALLVTMRAQLLAPFMLIYFGLPSLF
jgi:hypothetical protein